MVKVEIYTWQYCPFCIRAKALLEKKRINFEEYPIDGDQEAHTKMSIRANGRTTVPQIFINEKGIGGCDELYELESTNQLDQLINP
ncbi:MULTISPECIES: glutaredoxin 3 [unclassified Prochlorococcus]|uniref:glutaredoxin 3 n=1 Tax=unclassified Prochlorococcus TaxID=2627481 RepID=UPI000533A8FA|nr:MULTISPECIES: glutaredoxin 3 [unclassified Prochlorococcus]KGG16758.1 Glutaredoxin 3 (Grx1) [Prochlorococcus sp. MIT 0602]KGG18268.1 Glutaredoxin 3 (Grx1) [Prochlorococcus sp. MIT 0603]